MGQVDVAAGLSRHFSGGLKPPLLRLNGIAPCANAMLDYVLGSIFT